MSGDQAFNVSLWRMRRAVEERTSASQPRSRVHPELELIVSHLAKKQAQERAGKPVSKVAPTDVDAAVRQVLDTIRPRRGRSSHDLLRHHVEGMMALYQEIGGRPIVARREKNDAYQPQGSNALSEMLITVVQTFEPDASTTQIVNIIRDARRKYAGKPMRFRDFFPGYGATVDPETGWPNLAAGRRVQQMEWAAPIYCP
jgi:hypothetical protein